MERGASQRAVASNFQSPVEAERAWTLLPVCSAAEACRGTAIGPGDRPSPSSGHPRFHPQPHAPQPLHTDGANSSSLASPGSYLRSPGDWNACHPLNQGSHLFQLQRLLPSDSAMSALHSAWNAGLILPSQSSLKTV